ncbi:MAG: hypothetical protein ABI688_02925 [Bacteroidota bacterium]
MRRNLLLLLPAIILFLSSCSKSFEERLSGNWKLGSAWRKQFLGRDYFTLAMIAVFSRLWKTGMPGTLARLIR